MDKDYRIWTGTEMIYFSLEDILKEKVVIPSYIEKEMKYIGIKDINDRKIYEGDIVTCSDIDNTEETWAGSPIVFEHSMYCLKDDYPNHLGYYCRFEIIGNIYETPHLVNTFGDE